ncbi:hypothetical protein PBI_TRISCUIT_7 [Microbacterium phage Triscuit]|nr:hypothetical protein PBI_TRISCUIT_112 [Microbacterium phage Triscuit]AVR56984.1 hypothetical protein PBI_TRISCUIT_7 [Microbacterium phage Triscuit]
MNIQEHTRLADLALPYFLDDMPSETDMHEYIDDAHIDFDEDDTLHRRLATSLGEDMADLLHNGNDEDLNWSEADTEAVREDYYQNLDQIALILAGRILARIYAGPPQTEPTA